MLSDQNNIQTRPPIHFSITIFSEPGPPRFFFFFFQTRVQASKDKQRLSPPGRSIGVNIQYLRDQWSDRIAVWTQLELIDARMRRKPCFLYLTFRFFNWFSYLLVFVAVCLIACARVWKKKKCWFFSHSPNSFLYFKTRPLLISCFIVLHLATIMLVRHVPCYYLCPFQKIASHGSYNEMLLTG